MNTRPVNRLEARAREMAVAAGLDPDSRVAKPGEKGKRGQPAWCGFQENVKQENRERRIAEDAAKFADIANRKPQGAEFQNRPLVVFGDHDPNTLKQMNECMSVGNVRKGVICADGHVGYAQPVGGVIAYRKQLSISGVGYDIGCGNMAVRLDTRYDDIAVNAPTILRDIVTNVSFGVGRNAVHKVQHELFDDVEAWKASGMEDYRQKAYSQLGTVGGGNHYVDLFRDEHGYVWIGVHFGSRGTGHTAATDYLARAGGSNGMYVPPALVDEDSELGQRYIAAMQLGGRLAYAGREAVIQEVNRIIGGTVTEITHNNHNFAWKETHVIDGAPEELWVVRKGATPAFPGQRGFVGGSMGDDAVILEGVDSQEARDSLYSTVHGAGRLFSRTRAIAEFKRADMDAWLDAKGVIVSGGDLDESPMAYRRLPEVLARHAGSVKIIHTLKPFAVAMAKKNESDKDPWKD